MRNVPNVQGERGQETRGLGVTRKGFYEQQQQHELMEQLSQDYQASVLNVNSLPGWGLRVIQPVTRSQQKLSRSLTGSQSSQRSLLATWLKRSFGFYSSLQPSRRLRSKGLSQTHLLQEETFDGNQDWLRMGVLMTSGSQDLTVEQGHCFGDDLSSACPSTVIMQSSITSSFKSSVKPRTQQGKTGGGYSSNVKIKYPQESFYYVSEIGLEALDTLS